MKSKRGLGLLALSTLAVSAASANDFKLPEYGAAKPQAPGLFEIPKVGLRIGIGHWDESMVGAGIDVTFKVPFLPLPGLRLDAETWSRLKDIGGNLRGNAVSLLGIQTFTLAYAGIGPSYWFTSDHGDHNSGWGAKLLVGASFPKGFYAEASTIIGPSPQQVFVWVGLRF